MVLNRAIILSAESIFFGLVEIGLHTAFIILLSYILTVHVGFIRLHIRLYRRKDANVRCRWTL